MKIVFLTATGAYNIGDKLDYSHRTLSLSPKHIEMNYNTNIPHWTTKNMTPVLYGSHIFLKSLNKEYSVIQDGFDFDSMKLGTV